MCFKRGIVNDYTYTYVYTLTLVFPDSTCYSTWMATWDVVIVCSHTQYVHTCTRPANFQRLDLDSIAPSAQKRASISKPKYMCFR